VAPLSATASNLHLHLHLHPHHPVMTHTVLLNNVDHQSLRVITRRGAEYGDGVMSAVTFPSEFRSVQAHYPIVFRKTADGTGFEPVALFGFAEGQNLFLRPPAWDAAYLPLAVERLPFYIGADTDEPMVHIDLHSPRLRTQDGEAIFLPHGGSTDYMERMNSVLLAIHQGLQETPAFIAALLQHGLLEPFVFEFERADGTAVRLSHFYTVHEERLAALDAASLQQLHRAGHLQTAYMAMASLSQFRALIERQHRLDERQASQA
jgi:SapC